MKYLQRLLVGVFALGMILVGCDKVGDLPVYKSGSAPVLSSSVTATTPAPADSLKPVITFSWSNPHYAVDSSTAKYIVEIDSSGRGFTKSVKRVVTGALSTSYTAKELNNILLGYGFSFGVSYNMDVRITSSYANNNDLLKSNIVTVKMTPYKIPPKVVPPTSGRLFIVGSATAGSWNNPVPVPTQELEKLDSVTYGGVFDLIGSNEYLLLPVNGDWSHKFAVADNTISGLANGGDFGYDFQKNFPGPATSGKYKIIVDFQHGKFTVTPYAKVLPDSLYIVGDATTGGWNNPVPVPTQKFTRLNSAKFQIILPLTGGKQYLLLPVNGSWSHKFSVADNSIAGLANGGDFGYDLSQNFPGPAVDGTYKIEVDYVNYKFVVTKQ